MKFIVCSGKYSGPNSDTLETIIATVHGIMSIKVTKPRRGPARTYTGFDVGEWKSLTSDPDDKNRKLRDLVLEHPYVQKLGAKDRGMDVMLHTTEPRSLLPENVKWWIEFFKDMTGFEESHFLPCIINDILEDKGEKGNEHFQMMLGLIPGVSSARADRAREEKEAKAQKKAEIKAERAEINKALIAQDDLWGIF